MQVTEYKVKKLFDFIYQQQRMRNKIYQQIKNNTTQKSIKNQSLRQTEDVLDLYAENYNIHYLKTISYSTEENICFCKGFSIIY